ncbi:MAG: acyl-CoA thioesterase [Chlorobi bacterium]|nr:MAG: acyl-CoA thioesterase [Bacteroidota bacterium]KXK35171.1 MAG: thioesterase [Chlorobi bacterium OLB6]MBE2265816.1 acyl-CoA thioesterase [Flavobacteriales bacterium]MBL1160490.1 acyl-CoA thioesterase [Chlorobiota bacterium]MBW7853261.1 acyl-CoA thioesterase [Candidatus Kapabacteria bacterium]MCC6331250.1 acyl-CoA thioesterase [Ignavibacteria bacterium]
MVPVDTNEATIDRGPTEINGIIFNHRLHSRVRSYDVDRLGIVHNAVYLYWLEAARIEYFRNLGIPIDRQSFVTKHRFVVAKTEIEYFTPAQFDDVYTVFTRVSFVKKSSFGFDHSIRHENGTLIASAKSILVHLNPATHQPERIPGSYRDLILQFEGDAPFAGESDKA